MSYVPIFIDHRWIVGVIGDDEEEPRILTEEEVEDVCEALNEPEEPEG